ncbi:MAG: transketolase C-terminal domain-containing protein, partial [Gammaproteobacteria bacterium]
PGVIAETNLAPLPVGKAEVRRHGRRIAILAFGSRVGAAMEAGERLDATVVNMRFVKPLDAQLVSELADTHELIVTVEENTVQGGAGSAVNEALLAEGRAIRILNLGIPDRFIAHADQQQQLTECGLDAAGIQAAIKAAGASAAKQDQKAIG